MNKIYGIKNCGSVKKALEWFVARDLPFEFHDFRKEGIDPVLLDEWIAKTSCDVLLNRKGLLWRKLDKARREAVCDNPEGMRALMLENPVIIKRPVIVHPDGTEEIVRGSVVTETGIALRAEGDVRLKIIDNAKRFNDMADHWAKDAVEFASSRELFNGVGNDAFGPDRSMTRGMVSTVLARLAGADTAGGETWYAKGTVWAVENGISDGTNPEQPVTREQLAAMLYRYAGSPAVSGELGFDDADSISAWARDAVRWCVDNGILNGVGGNRMTPQDLARRGQVAAMLMRFLQATV